MSAAPGRGAHWGSGGIRSTGQTGLNSTVPFTPEPAPAGVVVEAVRGLVVEDVAGTVVVPAARVVGVDMVVVERRWPSLLNADSALPQATPRVSIITTVPSPRRPRRECTSQV